MPGAPREQVALLCESRVKFWMLPQIQYLHALHGWLWGTNLLFFYASPAPLFRSFMLITQKGDIHAGGRLPVGKRGV